MSAHRELETSWLFLKNRTSDISQHALENLRQRGGRAAARMALEARIAGAMSLALAANGLLALEDALAGLREPAARLVDRARVLTARLSASPRAGFRKKTGEATIAAIVIALVIAELWVLADRRARVLLQGASRWSGRRGRDLRDGAARVSDRASLARDRAATRIRGASVSISRSPAALVRGAQEAGRRLSGTTRRMRRAADRVLAERVRSRLGFVTTHAGAIDVAVVDGRAILSGHILAREASRVAASIRAIDGIKGVEQAWQRLDESTAGVLTVARQGR